MSNNDTCDINNNPNNLDPNLVPAILAICLFSVIVVAILLFACKVSYTTNTSNNNNHIYGTTSSTNSTQNRMALQLPQNTLNTANKTATLNSKHMHGHTADKNTNLRQTSMSEADSIGSLSYSEQSVIGIGYNTDYISESDTVISSIPTRSSSNWSLASVKENSNILQINTNNTNKIEFICDKPIKKWINIGKIGTGGYCDVYHVIDIQTNKSLAIKNIKISKNIYKRIETLKILKDLEYETELLSKISHPNIIKYFGRIINQNQVSMFLELIINILSVQQDLH